MQQYQIYIGGEWRNPSSQQWFESENPFDGKPWAKIPRCDAADVDLAVGAARKAFTEGPWSEMVAAGRGALLRKAGDLLIESAEHLADLETRDTGKRISESVPQIKYIAEWFQYYGGLSDKIEGRVIPLDRNDIFNYTLREPLGVVSAITPWNSPVMIAVWKIAPALAAGNTVVVKPSEHASASTIEMMKIFDAAGFPPGVVNVVTGFPQECGERLVSHPDVAKVTFTGSDRGGRQINRIAAESFKRVTMELGGKSPQIVFEDADLESAVNGVISGVFLSNGQTCVAGSRLYVHQAIAERFVNRLRTEMTDLKMGDPFDAGTQLAPIANRAQYDKILSFIDEAKAQGATCVHGGAAVEGPGLGQGLFIEPTIFTDVDAADADLSGRGVRPCARHHDIRHRRRGRGNGERYAVRPGCRCVDREHPAGPPFGAPDCQRNCLRQHLPGRERGIACRGL